MTELLPLSLSRSHPHAPHGKWITEHRRSRCPAVRPGVRAAAGRVVATPGGG
ncbi:hypothetical protein [Streptomyces sp. RKAG293]|uniref:hypothetical protein n=1 Tax=Streptomyces sp. RKAG293 TaxID=2893403 RepID=UPI00203393C9|nr:hypothetical protein [Streptomyces sp. RKAG293]MCM2417409.1 hypothetical protein [Streptomyces sp. RKAG293]